MKKTIYVIEETLKIAQIREDTMFGDVLDRIRDTEEFVDKDETLGERIFSVAKLLEMLIDEEDDTNETTKLRIEELYNQIEDFNYFMLTKV